MCDLWSQSECIIVDDHSPEATGKAIELIARKYNARYCRLENNNGPGIARNRGADMAEGAILLFIDSDCVPPEDWISRLTQPILEGACTATTACYSRPTTPSWITTFQNEDYLYRMPSTERDVSFVNSCNLAVDRNVFMAVDGFPAQRISEDMVLGISLARNGTPARYLPGAGIQHNYHRHLPSYLRQRFLFAINTIRSSVNQTGERYSKTETEIRSYNPVRTALGMFFCLLTVVCLAGAAFIFRPALTPIFLFGMAIGLILESLVHGRFLLFLIRRQGVARSLSYLCLLYLVDFVYLSAVAIGLLTVGPAYFRNALERN